MRHQSLLVFLRCTDLFLIFLWFEVSTDRKDQTCLEVLHLVFLLPLNQTNKTTHTHHGSASMSTLLFEPVSLLDEAHERSDSSPRADHDHRVGGFKRQTELGLADVHGNGGLVAIDDFVFQPVGCYSFVDAVRLGLVLHHHGTDVDAVGVNLQNRRVTNSAPSDCRSTSSMKICK